MAPHATLGIPFAFEVPVAVASVGEGELVVGVEVPFTEDVELLSAEDVGRARINVEFVTTGHCGDPVSTASCALCTSMTG